MNEIVNKLLSADTFMLKIYSLDLLIMLVDHLLKTKKEFKHLKKQEIEDIYTKIN